LGLDDITHTFEHQVEGSQPTNILRGDPLYDILEYLQHGSLSYRLILTGKRIMLGKILDR
jgi:hypothetical protein